MKRRLHTWLLCLLSLTFIPERAEYVLAAKAEKEGVGPAAQDSAPSPQRPDPRKAKEASERGEKAEEAGRWAEAFAFYSEAAELAPEVTEYQVRRERVRFRLVQFHLDRAELAHVSGHLEQARAEVLEALALDPRSEAARNKLAQLEQRALRKMTRAVEYDLQPVRLEPLSGTRSFNLSATTIAAYEEVARVFGLRATFDTDLSAKSFRFRVADVDFRTAVALLGEVTNTFIRPLSNKSFLVVNDTPDKRKQYSPLITRAIELPSATTPEQVNEIRQVVREIAGITNPQFDARTRQLVLRDTPENVALAMELIEELEQTRSEILLEVLALAVDRDAARRLGITPPSSARTFTLSPADIREAQSSAEGLLRVITRVFGQSAAGAGLSQQQLLSLTTGGAGLQALIPPLLAFGGGRTIFLATLPGASADFSDSLSMIRSARRVLLRAQDGTKASFFAGERFPVSLGVLAQNVGTPTIVPTGVTRRILEVGDRPVSVTTADFDLVNGPDLAVAHSGETSLAILINNGQANFSRLADLTTAASPRVALAAQFNSGGQADLAVAEDADTNNLEIFLGNGDGSFTLSTTLTAGSDPVALATGNFNADSNLDLVVASQADGQVLFFPGLGNGTFGGAVQIATGNSPAALTTGDFDDDGFLDVAVVFQGDNGVSVLRGDGNGNFQADPNLATGAEPTALTAGDLDADGNLDLVVANGGDGTIFVYLGNGDGSFDPPISFFVGARPRAVLSADFSRDGRLDVLVASEGTLSLTLLLGLGDGRFAGAVELLAEAEGVALASADFNGDGAPDAAAANPGADTVTVFLNSTTGTGVTPEASLGLTQAYPSATFEDLGIKVNITPRLHPNAEVTLQLELELRELGNATFNDIPVISNRTISQTVRLRENEPTILVNILAREETGETRGWPELSRAPGLGYLVARKDAQQGNLDLVVVITPHRLRLAPRRDRSFYTGRKDVGVRESAPPRQ
jgi:tetratricopeptide (TPR) repeat protein